MRAHATCFFHSTGCSFTAFTLVQAHVEILKLCHLQLQQACLLAELLLAVLLRHFAETNGDPAALSRLGDNRVSSQDGKQPCLMS